jgi:hypothetical protein
MLVSNSASCSAGVNCSSSSALHTFRSTSHTVP